MNGNTDPKPAAADATLESPLTSRRRDTARRRLQVHNAIAQLRTDGAVVTVSWRFSWGRDRWCRVLLKAQA